MLIKSVIKAERGRLIVVILQFMKLDVDFIYDRYPVFYTLLLIK